MDEDMPVESMLDEKMPIVTIGNALTWLISLPDEKMPRLIKGLIAEIIHKVGLKHPAIKEFFEQIDLHRDNVLRLFSLLHAYAVRHYGFSQADITILAEVFSELGQGDLFTVGITYVRAVENCILLSRIEADVDPPPRQLAREQRRIANELAYVLLHLIKTGSIREAVSVPTSRRSAPAPARRGDNVMELAERRPASAQGDKVTE